jgi:hypothetical protein
MKYQGHVLSPHSHHNNSASDLKDNELAKMIERKFRSLLLKMILDLKEDSNKQINEVRKSIQDIDMKVSNMEVRHYEVPF